MKYAALTLLAVLFAVTSASTQAKTAQGKISVSAQIVTGVTVSAFIANGEPVTSVRRNTGAAPRQEMLPYGAPPLTVSVQPKSGEVLLQRASWNKSLHLLTIDF